jgi:sterol desaturase/sphingolipid hydroxylase (fatty acid hydroxylase superfamily)
MIAIRAPYLEIAVLVLGVTILLLETFAAKIAKKTFAYAGIVGLAAVLAASFFFGIFDAADRWLLEFLHRRRIVDLLQAIHARHHDHCDGHDGRLRAGLAQS